MAEQLLKRYARRVAKGAWWLATPWRMGERLEFLRERAAAQARATEFALLVGAERTRLALRERGMPVPAVLPLDLFDDAAVCEAAGLPLDSVVWLPLAPQDVTDRWSAARFLIDLWRKRGDLRARCPRALENGRGGEFVRWLQNEGAAELCLGDPALALMLDVLDAGLADRARQALLANQMLLPVWPHGLTPVGMPRLFRWLMHHGVSEPGLRREEIWWLFLQAAQNPARELMLAWAFTPAWQELHPDGLTAFGREDFSAWFAAEYGASGRWMDASSWPEWESPALQIRSAYWARDAWRAAHLDALADEDHARALLAWLSSPTAGLSDAARAWCAGLDTASVARELIQPGVNMIGHFCYASGLRVSAESMVEAMGRVGVSASLRDVWTDAKDDPHHVDFHGMEAHDVTIIHTQPEPFFDEAYRRANLFERSPRTYRIGYWYWEFDSIPDSWVGHAEKVDEVWAATEFVARGFRDRLAIPVRTLFPGVKLAPYTARSKSYFGLEESPFTFLFTYHMMSVMERKNPKGLIRAFKRAFRPDEPVRLVLKSSFGDRHPAQMQELRDAAAGANITIIDEIFNPDEVLSLMDACDAYVSLHRSEGLGLTMAEAMLMGKPVIATNFSGNVDFMDDSNSLLVPYKLVKLGKPIPPYDADLEWAEPSEQHAAELMRRVYDNQAWAKEVGARGKASAEANLSLEAAGRRIAARLEEIKSLRRRSAG
ncbi:glycosyltransferase family 4 protein [Variovorax guangxiensis]|uniref:glycosyltransferase family 4 protein n=1 Tax=Variovorax guangxiensis TaxID=1775474 RepID=UPI002861E986|nr:glycosyltransferase family 4 protein [Variovorax guangxiensis]MDR6857565.1 glycosyltransferase involved in cell wall biosynthesis [Variovorax guangxiensis]